MRVGMSLERKRAQDDCNAILSGCSEEWSNCTDISNNCGLCFRRVGFRIPMLLRSGQVEVSYRTEGRHYLRPYYRKTSTERLH